MKVVKQPIRPVAVKDPLYEVQCPIEYTGFGGCGAVLQFRKSEISKIRDRRDGDD